MFSSSPMRSSLSCPPASEPSDVPCFQAHEWTPPSSSPPVGESSFATCHVSELSNPLLPLPPLKLVLPCNIPPFLPRPLTPPSSSPPFRESFFVTCHVSELTNPLLPLPPLQLVSPHL